MAKQRRARASNRTRQVVVVSDTHGGCSLALCPPEGVKLDEGGVYRPSEFQLQMWELWLDFWGQWVPTVTKGEPWDFVHNGDAIEGVHHRSTTQITHNLMTHRRIAQAVLEPVVKACKDSGGRYFQVRGTEAHVGQSAEQEEALAKELGAVPNNQGNYARWDLWLRVGDALVHYLHHIGTTGSAAHEASAVNAELTAEFNEAGRWGKEPPDYVVRSHRHRYIGVDINTAKGYGAAIVTPGWQGKTPFAFKIPGARLAEPQFGGILIRHGDEEHHYRRQIYSVGRSKEE